jgi:hypothetical protein
MIGVAVDSTDLQIAEEFFELFKTPWEQAVPGRKYRVVLTSNGRIGNLDADLFLVYGAQETSIDKEAGVAVHSLAGPVEVVEIDWKDSRFPVYCGAASFDGGAADILSGQRTLSYERRLGTRRVRRIGYDLFAEVRRLLVEGQPSSQALTPTLELHIALLRQQLQQSGFSFVEIPPRPHGYDFICCLTHDIDFCGIRRHGLDKTLAGFVVRASFGTLIDVVRGRRPWSEAAQNWAALVSLPFVYLGLARDFWHPFAEYARAEQGRRSTFFLVPFKGKPGLAPDSTMNAARAVPYGVSEIWNDVKRAALRASEFAVHGIDAWRDAVAGRAEMLELTALTGEQSAGVRMHWLYFNHESPRQLEAAGFSYDSTCGYNEAVGYRAGTSQVFRLQGTDTLMELPLSIMDSAMFFPGRMNLSHAEASDRCGRIVAQARHFGGTVVINWHDRSLVPERLWGRFYQELLDEVGKDERAWFSTAGQAVDWFRWRRSIRFTADASGNVTVAATQPSSSLPPALVHVHRAVNGSAPHRDELCFDGGNPVELAL